MNYRKTSHYTTHWHIPMAMKCDGMYCATNIVHYTEVLWCETFTLKTFNSLGILSRWNNVVWHWVKEMYG